MRAIELTDEATGVAADDIAARDVHAVDRASVTIPGDISSRRS